MYACAELFCVLTNVSNKFVFRRFPLRGGSSPFIPPCVRPAAEVWEVFSHSFLRSRVCYRPVPQLHFDLSDTPHLCLDHTFILSCSVQFVWSFKISGPRVSGLHNPTFSPATSPYHTSIHTLGIPRGGWLGNPTWNCGATPCPAQCSCRCSWDPGCWSATVEWSLNILLISNRFAFRAAFLSLPIIALLL